MKTGRIELLPLPEFGSRFNAESKWLVKGWIPDSELVFLVGPPKKKKSFLTVELSVALSTGSKFMGIEPTRTGPIVFMNLEDPPRTTNARFDLLLANKIGMGQRDTDLRQENIHVMLPGPFSLQHPPDIEALTSIITEIRPVLVVLDSLYCCMDMTDWGVSGVTSIKALKKVCVDYEVTIVIVHHSKKNATKDAEGLLGSQLLNSVGDGSIHIRSVAQDDGSEILTCARIWKSFASSEQEELVIEVETETDYHYDSFTRALPEGPTKPDNSSHDSGDHHGIPGFR